MDMSDTNSDDHTSNDRHIIINNSHYICNHYHGDNDTEMKKKDEHIRKLSSILNTIEDKIKNNEIQEIQEIIAQNRSFIVTDRKPLKRKRTDSKNTKVPAFEADHIKKIKFQKERIEGENDFSKSIFRVDQECADKNIIFLKIFGYAKILKDVNNFIFKFNNFLGFFKEILKDYDFILDSVIKQEVYIMRNSFQKNPLEVV